MILITIQRKVMSLLIVISCLFSFNAFSITGLEIATKVYNSNREIDSVQKIQMTLTDKRNKKRKRIFFSFSKDNNKFDSQTLIVFISPKKINKTAMLTHNKKVQDTNQWLYLPALKKTRRIAASKKSGRFVGSDLTYEDLEDREVSLDKHRFLKMDKIGATNYYLIESRAKKKSSSSYKKIRTWVNPKTWTVRRAEFYTNKKTPLKTLNILKMKKYKNSWQAIHTEIINHKEKHKTTLSLLSTKFNNSLKKSFFKKSILENHHKLKRFLK